MNIAVIFGEVAYISRSGIMKGIVDAAKADGSNVVLFTCEGFLYHHLKDYSQGEYNVFSLPSLEMYDGVIVDIESILNEKVRQNLYDELLRSKVPCVVFDQVNGLDNAVIFDNDRGFRQLIDHLIREHGCMDIHYISGPFSNVDAMRRLEVFREELDAHGLTILDEHIYEGDFNFSGGKDVAKHYLSSGKALPQAFVAANDSMAIGLMEELKEHGIRVPEDVIITGYDHCDIADYTSPRLTTVDRDEYRAGSLAYEKLKGSVLHEQEPCCSTIYGELIIGESCGCHNLAHANGRDEHSVVELKKSMDESLDLLKGLTLGLSNMNSIADFETCLERYVEQLGVESFYFCQCGSRESYYDELERIASGEAVSRDTSRYPDTMWCPIAYEKGQWHTYPSFPRRLLFPPASRAAREPGYYIVLPVHQGVECIGYSIIGNFNNQISGRVLQHFVLGIDSALGNIRKSDVMTTMLARINRRWQYDELTGLYNRSGFVYNVTHLIDRAKAAGKGVGVYFLDLDGLKGVNDTQGHEAGDRYIKALADLLKDHLGPEDIACRYGGDEYLVISAQDSWEDALKKLEEIQQSYENKVSASAGCTYDVISSKEELSRLIETADEKMYEYKRRKKRGN